LVDLGPHQPEPLRRSLIHVTVTWAQRSNASDAAKNILYLTVFAPDVPKDKLKIDLQPTSVEVTGESTTKNTTYHVKLDLFEEIDVEESKTLHTARDVAFVLRKKEAKEEFWPRLTKEKARLHFLKTDFDKWVDEDEQETVAEEDPMANMGGGMGGMPGMGGMGGMGEDGGFGGIDFSKLGGAGGMPDLSALGGAGGLGGLGGDDDDVSATV
jgi:hypothetical protein